eukprot:6418517-Amphidinium_carterae.1
MRKKDGNIERIQILRDTVEHKATGTLRIRALDLKRFLSWAEALPRKSIGASKILTHTEHKSN